VTSKPAVTPTKQQWKKKIPCTEHVQQSALLYPEHMLAVNADTAVHDCDVMYKCSYQAEAAVVDNATAAHA